MSDLVFRRMSQADLATVLEAEARLHAFPWTVGNFADSMDAGHELWVARDGDDIAAYAVTCQVLDEVHLLNISVLPAWQGQGCGTRVMAHLFASGKAQGGARMFLEVRPGNRAALGLYEKCGFIVIGRRKGYYPAHEGREDAIVMARDL